MPHVVYGAPALQRRRKARVSFGRAHDKFRPATTKKEGPMWDRALRFFVECADGYLAAAMALAS